MPKAKTPRKTTGGREPLAVRLSYIPGLDGRPDVCQHIADAESYYREDRARVKEDAACVRDEINYVRRSMKPIGRTARLLLRQIECFRRDNPGDSFRYLDRVRASLPELIQHVTGEEEMRLPAHRPVNETRVGLAQCVADILERARLLECRDEAIEEVCELDDASRLLDRAFPARP